LRGGIYGALFAILVLLKSINMKKSFLYIFLFLIVNRSAAQSSKLESSAKSPDMPAFSITKAPDSTRFERASLQKNKDVIIMVFSPDCEHCQLKIKEIMAHYNLFKNTQIVMVSNLGYLYVKKFYQEFKLAKYPNIVMGMDYKYQLGSFFNIASVPTLFLYNKKGKFVKTFDRNVPVQTIAKSL